MTEKKTDVVVNDLAGLGGAAAEAVRAIANGIGAIGGPLLVPAATEAGLLLQDKVRAYREKNAAAVLEKAGILLQARAAGNVKVAPKTAFTILEEAAWADDDMIQSMWAGLLASSCTPEGDDQGVIVFVNILKQLTRQEAQLISIICESADVYEFAPGFIYAESNARSIETLKEIWGEQGMQRADRELDHLHALGLTGSGFARPDAPIKIEGGKVIMERIRLHDINELMTDVSPTTLCLQLYARCNGCCGDVYKFFKDQQGA